MGTPQPGCTLACPSASTLQAGLAWLPVMSGVLTPPCVWWPLYSLACSVVDASGFLQKEEQLTWLIFFLADLGGAFVAIKNKQVAEVSLRLPCLSSEFQLDHVEGQLP